MSRKSGSADPASARETAADLANAGRFKQIRMIAGLVNKANPKALPIVFGAALGTIAVLVIIGLLTGLALLLIPLGVLLGVLVGMILFGRFAQAAQYSAIEGQPGAAAAVLENMRGNWTVTPAIAANRNMDVVHRTVGRPGVVLVGEGSPNRLASLMAAEKKRVARVAYEVPIFEFQVGNEEGQIPLGRLQSRMAELDRSKLVVVHCKGGYRSSIATSILRQAGLSEVANLIGGFVAWKAAGLPSAAPIVA